MLIIFIVLFGCGNNEKSRESSTKDGSKPIEITVWHTELDPGANNALKKIGEQLKPKGINVKIESISWGKLSEKLAIAIQTDTLPDIAHLQPFYLSSFVKRDLLVPLDDVYSAIGADNIFESVRNIGTLNGEVYGIPYALGTTYWSYRKDWSTKKGLVQPSNWTEFIDFAKALHEPHPVDGGDPHYGTILPGGSPFFIDQLAIELLASNGGQFVIDGKPRIDTPEFQQVLQFMASLALLSPPDWKTLGYQDQFRLFAGGHVGTVPVTYARAAKQIDKDAPEGTNNPEHFAVMKQLPGPSGSIGFATVDAEPWVIFKSSNKIKAAKEFLRAFYKKENYIDFAQQVPIHLTPIIKEFAESSLYLDTPFLKKWKAWQDASTYMLGSNRANPILVSSPEDRSFPYLFELQASHVISKAVVAVVDGADVKEAVVSAQAEIDSLIEHLSKAN
jgi:ABC-type glycerol-3-phosphate transport system substrate-binding protein